MLPLLPIDTLQIIFQFMSVFEICDLYKLFNHEFITKWKQCLYNMLGESLPLLKGTVDYRWHATINDAKIDCVRLIFFIKCISTFLSICCEEHGLFKFAHEKFSDGGKFSDVRYLGLSHNSETYRNSQDIRSSNDELLKENKWCMDGCPYTFENLNTDGKKGVFLRIWGFKPYGNFFWGGNLLSKDGLLLKIFLDGGKYWLKNMETNVNYVFLNNSEVIIHKFFI